MKAYYDEKPKALEAVGNGGWLYRWDIAAYADEDGNEKWQCQECTAWAPLTANKITEAVIAECWSASREQKLVNDYNMAQMGLLDEGEAQEKAEAYKAFLSERAAVKRQVDADCKEAGID